MRTCENRITNAELDLQRSTKLLQAFVAASSWRRVEPQGGKAYWCVFPPSGIAGVEAARLTADPVCFHRHRLPLQRACERIAGTSESRTRHAVALARRRGLTLDDATRWNKQNNKTCYKVPSQLRPINSHLDSIFGPGSASRHPSAAKRTETAFTTYSFTSAPSEEQPARSHDVLRMHSSEQPAPSAEEEWNGASFVAYQ